MSHNRQHICYVKNGSPTVTHGTTTFLQFYHHRFDLQEMRAVRMSGYRTAYAQCNTQEWQCRAFCDKWKDCMATGLYLHSGQSYVVVWTQETSDMRHRLRFVLAWLDEQMGYVFGIHIRFFNAIHFHRHRLLYDKNHFQSFWSYRGHSVILNVV